MPKVLNVGGGNKSVEIPPHYNGWEHLLLDIDPRGESEFVCDARALRDEFPARTYDAVYCSHNLEHYYRHDLGKVLGGFLHVLKDEGFAEIRVPNIGALITALAEGGLDIEQGIYSSAAGLITAHDMVYGYDPEIEASGKDFYAHKTGFTRESLVRALRSNGFGEVYIAAPLSLLELRAFAFKTNAGPELRTAYGLGEPELSVPPAAIANRPPVHAPAQARPDPVESAYQQAVAAWRSGDWNIAAGLASRAIAAQPASPALHYLLACCRLDQGDYARADAAFSNCIESAPACLLGVQAAARRALCRARIDLQNGVQPLVEPLAPQDARPISVVVCSNDAQRLAKSAAAYRRLLAEVPLEIILIDDARSFAQACNRGLRKAGHEIVVFVQDDVEVLSPDFAALLLRSMRENDLVGIAGTRKLAGGAWECSEYPHLCGQIGVREAGGRGTVVTLYGVGEALSAPLQALDGPLLAVRREAALRLGFDEATFDGRALHYLDFSLRASRAGLVCATCNEILAVRESPAGRDEQWLSYSLRFMNKHKLERPLEIFPQADLASVPVQSFEEWRLMTQHLIAVGRLPAPARADS